MISNHSKLRKVSYLPRTSRFAGAVLAASLAATPSLLAQVRAPQPSYPVPGGGGVVVIIRRAAGSHEGQAAQRKQ